VEFVKPRVATPKVSIWIGWDPREAAAFAVARSSAEKYALRCWPVRGVVLSRLQAAGLYRRPIAMHPGVDREIMWDVLSDAPMSTEHANARFLVPHLAKQGWALFMDGDMLVRSELGPMFNSLDPQFAVYCVKHRFDPPEGVKMDGQAQSRYARKNWSSFLIFNCDHPANEALTLDVVNTLPGRDLHRLCWLEDELIGELGPEWNFLVGHTDPSIEPKCIHWTSGVPDMRGYENVAFAAEWRATRDAWAQGPLNLGAG
jgi:hypothetical protein